MKDVEILKGMITSGVNNLYNNYPHIDKLNVFPVPDGDTGTNMNLTCTNGLAEIEKENFDSIGALMTKFARGLIMGARGNSGVIFSQIIKGFSNAMKNNDSLTLDTWKQAFLKAKEVAYAAVMKPVEGTMLTVVRETSDFVNSIEDKNIDVKTFWAKTIEVANKSLENTPNLLPALKEVGVVDSGGYGFVKFLVGAQHYAVNFKPVQKLKKLEENTGGNLDLEIEQEFGYCTETIVILNDDLINKLKVDPIRSQLEQYGNTSIVAVIDENILKIHTHALLPGQVLTYLQQYGEFKTVKVENMNIQAEHQVKDANDLPGGAKATAQKQRTLAKKFATIAVVRSAGMQKYFKEELNIDFVIDGGAKMNPSTNDFLKAIEEVDAEIVYIFPNDSNVYLAAKQAKTVEKMSKVIVLDTKTIPQGMTGYLSLDPEETPRKNESNVSKAIKNVTSVTINKAARDANIDGVTVKEGQYMMSIDKKVIVSTDKLVDIFNKHLSKYISTKTEIITIFTGADASFKDISDLRKILDENFDVEYEVVDAGQEVYSFIMGIE